MGVNLHCPGCGRIVGEASHEDDYKEIFYYHDYNNQPICPTCGDNKFPVGCLIAFGVIIAACMVLGFIFQ